MTDREDMASLHDGVDPDAELKFVSPSTAGKDYGPDEMIVWEWMDNRMTVTPTEHGEMKRLINEAEEKFDCNTLRSDAVVARIWMKDDETIDQVEWCRD